MHQALCDGPRDVRSAGRFDGWPTQVAFVLVSLSLFSGCAATTPGAWFRNGFKVGPNYCRPAAPVAPQWIEADDPRVDESVPRDQWWQVFRDPTLSSLVARAERRNPDVRAAGARIFQARAQRAIAAGNVFPQSQSIDGQYTQGTFDGNPTHINMTSFNLSWELDFWGKYRRQVESADASLDASADDYDAAVVTLVADVAQYYVQYRVAQQRIKIARDNVAVQERLLAIVEEQNRVGTATALDVEQLRTLVEQTRSTIPALEIALGEANDKLCILLGEPPRDLEPELGPGPSLGKAPMPTVPTSVATGIPINLLGQRPDVRSAERQVAAQNAKIGVAEAALYPSVALGTTLGHADIELGPALTSSGGLALIMPQFSWNILNYGRLANNIDLQEAKTQELIATYQSKVLTAAQEVQTALRAFLRSQEQATHLARSATAAAAAMKTGDELFVDVDADVNRLFTLENSRLRTQDELAVAQGNVALNLVEVYRALGGGWQVRRYGAPATGEWILVEDPDAFAPEELPPPIRAMKRP